MANILVGGVQRSGTTLAGLILRAHSKCSYVEEPNGWNRYTINYLNDAFNGYKMTEFTQYAQTIIKDIQDGKLPPAKMVFCYRDRVPTVASMLKLNWVTPHLAGDELRRAVKCLLDSPFKDELKGCMSMPYDTHAHIIGTATVCAKMYFLAEWSVLGDVYALSYEKLTENPEEEVRKLDEFLSMDYEDVQINFQKKFQNFTMHGTEGANKITTASKDKWKEVFGEKEVQEILEMEERLCNLAEDYFAKNVDRIRNFECYHEQMD